MRIVVEISAKSHKKGITVNKAETIKADTVIEK